MNTAIQETVSNHTPRVRAMRQIRQWMTDGALPRGERIPTVGELVERLGVSRGTVHGALLGLEQEGLIRSSGRAKFALGPAPKGDEHLMAETVGILSTLPQSEDSGPAYSGWENQIQVSASNVLSGKHHVLVLNPDRLQPDRIRQLARSGMRGAMLSHFMLRHDLGAKLAHSLNEAKIPLVVYGSAEEFPDQDTVYSDHESGAHSLTHWLLGKGCRRILRVWHQFPADARPSCIVQRDAGYERAMREAEVEPIAAVEVPIPALEDQTPLELFRFGTRTMVGFLIEHLQSARPVDALMVISDGVVPSVVAACRMLGKTPNQDVLVAGYDNYWRTTTEQEWEPCGPAATVDKCNERMGEELARLLEDRMSGSLPAEPQHRLVQPELVAGSPCSLHSVVSST